MGVITTWWNLYNNNPQFIFLEKIEKQIQKEKEYNRGAPRGVFWGPPGNK